LQEGYRKRYFEISDLAAEVESVKQDQNFALTFTYYNTSGGINEFVRKLPKRLREKWASQSDSYKMKNNTSQAPFSLLTKFLRDIARVKNDPGYVFESAQDSSSKQISRGPGRNVEKQSHVSSRKTSTDQNSDCRAEENPNKDKSGTPAECPMHGSNLNSFKFLRMSVKRRKDFLFKNGYCLRCCGPRDICENIAEQL
jgi:hypothetical protein